MSLKSTLYNPNCPTIETAVSTAVFSAFKHAIRSTIFSSNENAFRRSFGPAFIRAIRTTHWCAIQSFGSAFFSTIIASFNPTDFYTDSTHRSAIKSAFKCSNHPTIIATNL